MFSLAQPKSRAPAPPKNSHVIQAPRGFAVRLFKNPTSSTFPYTATAKFDVGYRLPTPAPGDSRQTQNWYGAREPPPRQPLPISRVPSKSARPGSWTDNRVRPDTPRPNSAAVAAYADFIYERSLSSKSDVYSETDTESTTTFSPAMMFSPTLSADSTLHSEIPTTATSSATNSPSHERNPFPLHIPALDHAQTATRGMVGQAYTSPTPIPSAPTVRAADLPQVTSPPRLMSSDAPGRSTSPTPHLPLSESPQPVSLMDDYFTPPPPSVSESVEAERAAQRNAQHNAATSAYYQANLSAAVNRSATQARTSLQSVRSSSFQTDSNSLGPGVEVYESSSILTEVPSTQPPPGRVSPPTAVPVAFMNSDSSSITAVNSDSHRPRLDSFALNAARINLPVPVSQLVELGSPVPPVDARRTRVLGADGELYEELRGLDMLSDRQRATYFNAFAPGTHPQAPLPAMGAAVPAVVRSDSSGGSRGAPSPEGRTRRVSGNLWSSLPQLPSRQSPVQAPPRAASTPPLPRLDTSRGPSPERAPPSQRQSPPRRESPPTLQPLPTSGNSNRSRTPGPVTGPRIPQPEPRRRSSEGDQRLSMPPPPSAMSQRQSPPTSEQLAPQPRPSRTGALPLDPQRRRSDGFQSVVPPRPTTPSPGPAPGPSLMVPPRNVRWNEVLICPSPITSSQRRKGWFNRRGDQLWTNDGAYKPPPSGQEYPEDLRDYPEHGCGWMNEDCVRIDMGHRLIPKAPLRSALKQPRGPVIRVEQGQSQFEH